MFNLFKKKEKHIYGNIPTYNPQSELAKKYKNYDSKLLKKYGRCNPFNKHIRIVTFADTHGHLAVDPDYNFKVIPEDIDACILLGDISKDDINHILEYIDKDKIFGILGNHDYDTNLSYFDIKNINNEIIDINGIKITGIEGCIKYKNCQPGYTLEEGFSIVEQMEPADICITHSPPFGILGLEHNSIHIGAPYINEYAYKAKCPLIICGHNHVDYTKQLLNGTTVIGTYKQRIIDINGNNITNLY